MSEIVVTPPNGQHLLPLSGAASAVPAASGAAQPANGKIAVVPATSAGALAPGLAGPPDWFAHSVVHTPEDNREITLDSVSQDLLPNMSEHGQKQPGIISPHPTIRGEWWCVEGNRRLFCCRVLNRPFWALPLLKTPSPVELIEIRMDIDLFRKPMDKAELGANIYAWIEETGSDQVAAATRFRLSTSYASKLLAPYKNGIPELIEALKARKIVLTGAPAIASLPPEQQREVLPLCIGQKRYTVENIVGQRKGKKPKAGRPMKLDLGGGVSMQVKSPTVAGLQAAMEKLDSGLKKLARDKDLRGNIHLLPSLLETGG